MDKTVQANLTNAETWMRLVYMILFGVIFYVAELVLVVTSVVQFLFRLFTGAGNVQLGKFGAGLAAYFQSVAAFLTLNSEEKPFPFAPWPDPETDERPATPVDPLPASGSGDER